MTMHKQILYILSLLGILSFTSCSNEENPLFPDETGEIIFSVVDTTEVEITTKASLNFDVNEFNVSLSRGNEPIFSNKKYGDIAGTAITCSASPDYVLTAESCTETEAESANQGWGQARVSGKESFAVVANDSKTVTVNCGLANSSVSVDFSDYITSMFTAYSIEIHATDAPDRSFSFNENNYKFKTAYFNVGEDVRKLAYTVTLPSPYKVYSRTLNIVPSKSYKLSVKVGGENENTSVTLEVLVNEYLHDEIVLTENINPYQ